MTSRFPEKIHIYIEKKSIKMKNFLRSNSRLSTQGWLR